MKLAQKIAINYIRAKLNIIAVLSKKRLQKKHSKFSARRIRNRKKSILLFLQKPSG